MKRNTSIDIAEWASWVVKVMSGLLMGAVSFYTSQLNTSIGVLNSSLKAIELHVTEHDKKILAIEVSRENGMKTYERMQNDFELIKAQTITNSVKLDELVQSYHHK